MTAVERRAVRGVPVDEHPTGEVPVVTVAGLDLPGLRPPLPAPDSPRYAGLPAPTLPRLVWDPVLASGPVPPGTVDQSNARPFRLDLVLAPFDEDEAPEVEEPGRRSWLVLGALVLVLASLVFGLWATADRWSTADGATGRVAPSPGLVSETPVVVVDADNRLVDVRPPVRLDVVGLTPDECRRHGGTPAAAVCVGVDY